MTFYGKDPEPKSEPTLKTFCYRNSKNSEPRKVVAHNVYFYDSGHVGFWNEKDDDDESRTLVLAVKANEVWEETE